MTRNEIKHATESDLGDLLDALVAAVDDDPDASLPAAQGEFDRATDALARARSAAQARFGRLADIRMVAGQIKALDAADREEYARLPDEHDDDPPELPEPQWHRLERLEEWYLAPADVAGGEVLAAVLRLQAPGA